MPRRTRQPSLGLSSKYFSYEALQQAQWKDFERFAIDVLGRYYKPFGLSITRTEKRSGSDIGSDGSRDGEGTIVFGVPKVDQQPVSVVNSLVNPSLGVLMTLWVEVKQRSSRNVNHHDVGGTIFRSSLEYVSKIVFVSNRGFTQQFSRDLERYALRSGRQFGLIDGQTLIRIAEQVLTTGSARKSTRTARPNSQPTESITTKLHLVLDPAVRYSEVLQDRLERSLGDPIFIIAESHIPALTQPFDFLSLELFYTGTSELLITSRSGNVQHAVGAGEKFRAVFAVFPDQPQELSLNLFDLRITDREGRVLNTEISRGRESCIVKGTILPDWIPPSKMDPHQKLRTAIEAWLKSNGSHAADVVAIAGAGKSHLIRAIRPTWLRLGAMEIFLDGARQQTANATALSLLSQVFPIPMDEVTSELSEILTEWLIKSGLTADSASALSDYVCSQADESKLPFNTIQLGHFLALILARRSQLDPIILIFEDLHKCMPSSIGLLRALRSSLTDLGGGRVFTLFTTREDSVWNDDAVRDDWRAAMELMRVGIEVPQFRLKAFSQPEAMGLLRHSIPTIEDHYAEAIIEQVGTTPFGLREALAFLRERQILEPAHQNGVWHLSKPDALLRAIDTQELHQATHYRLLGLKERYPEWLADFLDGGACLGQSFDPEICAGNAKGVSSAALEKALAECRLLEIIRFSMFSPSRLQFDHDLIRKVLLEDMGAVRQRRLARGLFDSLIGTAGVAVLGALAYQAGLGEECWKYSLKQADLASSVKRHMEAVHALGLALAVTDQNVVTKIFDVQEGRYRPSFDEAIAVAEPCTRDLTRDVRERETAQLLLRYIEHLVAVGSGGTPSIDKALTEAEMLAERHEDNGLRATLKMYHGRQEFNRDKPHESLELHEAAETIFASLRPTREVRRRRSQNLVRLAIAYRQTGQLKESRQVLIQALREQRNADWSLATQVRANVGATYFYLDWNETRRHWSRALSIAEAHNLHDRKVHSLVDVAHLDLLDDKLESAEENLEQALLLSKEYGLENSELRCLLNLGCLAMMRRDPLQGLDLFRHADRLGFRHGIGRRLWRVRANMATAYFILGDAEKSFATDKVTLNSMPSLEGTVSLDQPPSFSKTRLVLALANIVLRANNSAIHRNLLFNIPNPILNVAREMAQAVTDKRLAELPGLRGRHCKRVGDEWFFVITE